MFPRVVAPDCRSQRNRRRVANAVLVIGILCLGGPFAWGQSDRGTLPLHVVCREDWLNRLLERVEVQPGVVNDTILGTKVEGQQQTTTRLRIDLTPSADRIAGTLVLLGESCSQSRGLSDRATLFLRGTQHFQAQKEILFDGNQFSTRSATITVRAQNEYLGASTELDGTPLQPLASGFVVRMAERRRNESEEIARNKVADKVYPRFNGEIDQQLARANEALESQVRSRLKTLKLMPVEQMCRSTDQELHYAARLVERDQETEVLPPASPLLGTHGARIFVHVTLLNQLLDRLPLAGQTLSDRQLKKLLDPNGPPSAAGVTGLETQIDFDQRRPLSVVLDNDELILQLRARFRPAGQTLLPPLIISIPCRVVRDEAARDWVLRPGKLGIAAQSTVGSANTLPPAAETLLRQAISASLREIPIPAELGGSSWPSGRPQPQLAAVRMQDGWLAIGVDSAPLPTQPSP